jgi:hypothetical protein
MLRRIALICMICALPLQTVWAAAVYRAHESGCSADYSSHHGLSSIDAEKPGTEAMCRGNCAHADTKHADHDHAGHNHVDHGYADGLMTERVSFGILSARSVLNSAGALFHPHAVFERPNRPKWLAAF